jgi:hypothetical protein
VIALSPVGHRPGVAYKMIPPGDLAVRAKYELREGAVTVIDCGTGPSVGGCQQAAITLSKMGYKVVVADLPRRSGRC